MPHLVQHPKHAQIWFHFKTGDFIDSYAAPSDLTPQEALKIAFDMPAWANALMQMRNAIVSPLGIKTDKISEASTNDTASLFPVIHADANQIVFGADDSHLNFRIAIAQHENQIHMATWVHRNNWIGHVYLAIVMPFHKLIVRGAMRRIARAC